MQIGLFQLENLIISRAGFCFLDLGALSGEAPEGLQEVLEVSEKVHSEGVHEYLQTNSIEKTYPIVLMCKDGNQSGEIAKRLEASGYLNVYVVTRGVSGLLEEL